MAPLANDLPDDYAWFPGSTRYPMTDAGELAARLGSPVVYDRRGEVIYIETFSYGLSGWGKSYYGTGGDILLTANYPASGPYQLKMIAGSDNLKSASVMRNFRQYPLQSAGVEINFAMLTAFDYMSVLLYYHDGTRGHSAKIRISDANNKLGVLTGSTTYTDFADFSPLVSAAPNYGFFKLVADFDNDVYKRLSIDTTEYDLSEYAIPLSTFSYTPYLDIQIQIYSLAGGNGSLAISHVILTGNDP